MSTVRRIVLALLITLPVAGLLGPLFAMVTVRARTDPWFGAHAALVCARVCEGCHGPYEVRGGTQVNGSSRRGKASKMYCQPPRGTLDEAGDMAPYELAGGSIWVMLGAWALVVPATALATFAVLTAVGKRKHDARPA